MARSIKAALLLALTCALAAHAEPPPVDPWADSAWQDLLYGLSRGQVSRLRASQQLFNVHAAAAEALSTREVQLEFDGPGGRVSRLVVNEDRRGESRRSRSYAYVYEADRLRRIDEDGHAVPAVTRRYDDAGRPIEQSERTGAVIARTTWRHDAAGRLLERTVDSGTGSRTVETRRYRRDGSLERLQVSSGRLLGKRVEFDAHERPVRIQVTDLLDRHETAVTYPSPTEAVHTTTGFATTRDATGRYANTTHYRVRAAQELRGLEAPELPTLRRHVRGTRHDEAQTEYDAGGRILVEHQLDAGGHIVCSGRFTYHASGPPLSVRNQRARPDAPCRSSDLDNDVKTDERGHWAEQRMSLLQPDGKRRLISLQTRRIEYAR